MSPGCGHATSDGALTSVSLRMRCTIGSGATESRRDVSDGVGPSALTYRHTKEMRDGFQEGIDCPRAAAAVWPRRRWAKIELEEEVFGSALACVV